ncbi:MAG: hypothetical protein IPH05_11245 [Flavobacteriales bacterium]|jgi:hypothetical protein|nr:hypothetical protein [Flavobacteriales bacterium]MBK6549812.1 hypothetical protein [Flavobacteriales bacterium]MBK6883500.1 hypothetical protein [Flavobacteriales bacterium]MBK7102330.1 hypothetical protein [Flavobacteriales bacterium]MBK7113068.1 hypothetical protein [Flavobacteriales bacterium]
MKVLVHALIAIITFVFAEQVRAQDRIQLMNGEVINGKILGQSTLEVRYVETRKNGRTRERAEPTEEVFSVTDSLGRERIWYFYDTIFGNDLTIEQMRWFIQGERDARKGYKPTWPMIEAFAVGAGLTIGFNWEMNSLFVPPITAGVMALPRVYITKGSISDPTMEGNAYYATGYARVGRSKRVVRSLIAGFVGIGVGLAVRQLIINPNLATE